MPTIPVPIQSPVDLETRNIIQGDFSFTKKNSLVHQGLLSNITSTSTTGLFSTTGKEITNDGRFEITVGDQTIRFDGDSGWYSNVEAHLDIGEEVLTAGTYDDDCIILTKQPSGYTKLSRYDSDGKVKSSTTINPPVYGQEYDITADIVMNSVGSPYKGGIAILYQNRGTWALRVYGITIANGEESSTISTTYLPSLSKTGSGTLTNTYMAYNGVLTISVDSIDMRNRQTWVYDSLSSTTHLWNIKGFGCPARVNTSKDNYGSGVDVLVTGEPVLVPIEAYYGGFFGYNFAARLENTYFIPSNFSNVDRTLDFITKTFQINSTTNDSSNVDQVTNGYYTTLDNGVLQYQPFNPTMSNITYTRYETNPTTLDALNTKSAVKTQASSWLAALKVLGVNPPDSMGGDQSNYGNIANTSITSFMNTQTDNSGFVYVYALRILPSGNLQIKAFDAMTRYMPPAACTTAYNGTRPTSGFGLNNEARNWGTLISYLDFDDPIGIWGDAISDATSTIPGTQIFPHFRFFTNDTTKKGVLWDYGRGWSKFYRATLEVQKGNSFHVFERPLELWTVDYNSSPKIEYLDMSSGPTVKMASSTPSDMLEPTITAYNGNVDIPNTSNEVTFETKFVVRPAWNYPYTQITTLNGSSTLAAFMDNGGASNLTNFMHGQGTARLVRYHPMTDAMKSASTWQFSHSIGGINENSALSTIPFSIALADDFTRVQIYNGIEISLSVKGTLIPTPHDMGDKYNHSYSQYEDSDYNMHYSGSDVFWGTGSVSWITYKSINSGYFPIRITKLTDYIFKTNLIGASMPNILVESKTGSVTTQRAFIPYVMDSTIDAGNKNKIFLLPEDSSSYTSNDVYYYGFGYNVMQNDNRRSSSFLLPAVTISSYVSPDDLYDFNKTVLNGRKGLFRAIFPGKEYAKPFVEGEAIDEFYTHSQATTDIGYKNSRVLLNTYYPDETQESFNEDLKDTSWWLTTDTVVYPMGLLSQIFGENYITSTVSLGDEYVSRFYRNNGKTFLGFNMKDQVYQGQEIFTIQSGNYYFDGQGIYYLGSQTDYSQNIFTAYAIGMKFLANSSSEAYFYSIWDKTLYVYTASNTLQKAQSLADMGDIYDAVYSSAEQALYIVFGYEEDGYIYYDLYIKTQIDSCLIGLGMHTSTPLLQTTSIGCQVILDGSTIYSPYLFDTQTPLELETEWLGNGDVVSRYQYVDLVFYSDDTNEKTATVQVQALNGGVVSSSEKTITLNEWNNQLCRVRVVPEQIIGSAVKVSLTATSDDVRLFSMSISAEPISQVPSASRSMRY